MSYREQKKAWLALNPLRQWRLSRKLSLEDVGSAIGVGFHTIYRWESGMSVPGASQMNTLSNLMKEENLQKKLQEWKEKRPILGKEE